MQQKKQTCLNGIKGIGACIVAFAWHYQHFGIAGNTSPFFKLMPISYSYGWCMVELFFMLSGFCMMMGYGNKIHHHEIRFIDYIKKRLTKLYPLFALTTLVVIFLEIAYFYKTNNTFVYPNFDLYHFVLNVFMLQNGYLGTEWSLNSPSWCLSICMICYMLFYFIVYRQREKHHIYYYFAFTSLLGLGIFHSGVNYAFLNILVARGLSCFSIGVLLHAIYEHKDHFNTKRLGYMCLLFLGVFYVALRKDPQWIGNFPLTFILGGAPAIILAILFVPWLNKLFSLRPMVILGDLSIAIYLIHFPIQCIIVNLDLYMGLNINYASKVIWMIYVTSVLLCASIYRYVWETKAEKWILNFFAKTPEKNRL